MDDPRRLESIVRGLERLTKSVPVVFLVHPRTKKALESLAVSRSLLLRPPVGHAELVVLAKHAAVGLTDSGGLQKELYWLGTPCVTIRSETEWVETLATGWNRLVAAVGDEILQAAEEMMGFCGPRPELYGDGGTALRIVDSIQRHHRGRASAVAGGARR